MPIKRTITFRQWRDALGPVMPLRMVPAVLNLPAGHVKHLVEKKLLPVHTFASVSGKQIRVVKVADVKKIRCPEPKITMEGMRRAFEKMVAS